MTKGRKEEKNQHVKGRLTLNLTLSQTQTQTLSLQDNETRCSSDLHPLNQLWEVWMFNMFYHCFPPNFFILPK